jgi:heat shock protein 4
MDDYDFGVTLTADEYEQLCAPLIARLNGPIEKAIQEAKLSSPSDLASVEIVGGGTRVGVVKRTLSAILGLDTSLPNNGLSTTMNADEAIARGAALQSAILSPRFKVLPYEIVEYNPYPVKIAWDGEATSGQNDGVEVEGDADNADNLPSTNSVVMFDRGSNFPCVRRVTLRRSGEFLVTASYDDTCSNYNFPEGVSRDIVSFKVKAPEGKDNKVRVNVKHDIHGSILLSSAQMVEEIVEEATSEEAAEGEDGKTAEKKKKIKKTLLEYFEFRIIEWTKAEIEKEFEAEVAMANADRIIRETADMRNELESYIYDMRDKIISDSQLGPYCTEEEKSTFSSILESTENWLYEDGFDATKSVYFEKLSDLKKHGDPMEFRQKEAANRPNAVSVLQRTVEKYNSWLNSSEGEEQYSHITHDEFTKCHDKCDEISSWMYDMMDKQGSLAANVNPAVTVAEINRKAKELTDTVSPIMHKPKPKPKPKAEEKKTEDKKEEAAASEKTEEKNSQPEPMDVEEKTTEPESMDTK